MTDTTWIQRVDAAGEKVYLAYERSIELLMAEPVDWELVTLQRAVITNAIQLFSDLTDLIIAGKHCEACEFEPDESSGVHNQIGEELLP